MALRQYRDKRRFEETPEPRGSAAKGADEPSFVVQKHAASHLHYDFRLQIGTVLVSWAVPKGPSTKPGEKRLAVHVEDHPLEYGSFEGVIPKGHYGAGTVEIWDKGTWIPESDPRRGLRAGSLKFRLKGKRLKGSWALVRMAPKPGKENGKENWLLIKHDDAKPKPRAVKPRRVASPAAPTSELPGARRSALPTAMPPQLATLVKAPPAGDAWLHEIKFDGYRLACRIENGRVRLITRGGHDWTHKFETIATAAAALPVRTAWLDGEAVAEEADGRHTFQALQRALKTGKGSMVYYAFDLPYLDGRSLQQVPLEARKEALAAIVGTADGPIRYSDHVQGDGSDTYMQACRMKLEGVVSKRRDGFYQVGRTADWQKSKCHARQEFIIGGYSSPAASRNGFGALLLGVRGPKGRLTYAGRVGTGFDVASRDDIHRQLAKLHTPTSPFADPPTGSREANVHWVRPELVAEVAFTEWTADGHLRHPSFQGLRADKPASAVRREVLAADTTPRRAQKGAEPPTKPAPRVKRAATRSTAPSRSARPALAEEPVLTHPERVLYADMGVTKLELAAYYRAVADLALPHLAQRPLALVRCPKGAEAQCFYQKHVDSGAPDAIQSMHIKETSTSGEYPWIRDVEGLVGMVQMGVLEMHPWGSRVDDIERPDRIIFDIDPDPKLTWARVVEMAVLVRERLEAMGLESWIKTTGGKGVHVVVPIQRRHEWPIVKEFAAAVARDIAERHPDKAVAVMSKARRAGRIFIDYLRNGRGATAVAAYSTRARAGAPVATPISWDELAKLGRADAFDVRSLPKRLARLRKDPWATMAGSRQSLTQSVLKSLATDE